jgi:HAD superfamily hydrolase (TIGR01662 family)
MSGRSRFSAIRRIVVQVAMSGGGGKWSTIWVVDRNSSIQNWEFLMSLNVSVIRAICFDVDGTLSDTDDVMVEKLARLLKPFHFLFPHRQLARISRRIVMAAEAPANSLISIPDLLGLDKGFFSLADWLARHSRKKPGNFLMIPGVKEMLAELSQHYPLAVVSARDSRTTNSFLEQYDLQQYFKCIATAQTCKHTKPFPDPILWSAQQMEVSPHACLMVGDTTVDMRAARAAGAQKVGVLCGFGESDELQKYGADVILDTTADLEQLLGK